MMTLRRRDILTHRDVLTLVATAVFVCVCVVFRRFNVDDAFISFRYARNLGDGLGAVMNPGAHVEGVSNLPWTALLGLVSPGLEPHLAAPILAIACGAVCLAAVAEVGSRWIGDRRAGGLSALLLALAAPFAVWGVSGLETLAFTLLVTFVFLYASGRHHNGWGIGLLLGLVASMRPEGILYTLPVLGAEWATTRRMRRLAAIVGGAVLVVLPLEVFRILYYGDWLPNPVRAKANFGVWVLAAGLVYVAKMLAAFPLHTGAAAVAGRVLARGPRLLFVGWIAVPAFVALVAGGERFPAYRLMVPAWPAFAIAAELSLRVWRRRALSGKHVSRPMFWMGGVTALVGVVVLWRADLVLPLGKLVLRLVHTYRDDHVARLLAEARFLGACALGGGATLILGAWLQPRLGRVELVQRDHQARQSLGAVVHESGVARRAMATAMLLWCGWTCMPTLLDPSIQAARLPDPAVVYGRPVGRWLRTAFPDSTRVATNAAGALPYESRLPIIDMLGLTDAHIATAPVDRHQWPGHGRGDGAYVMSRRPDIVIFGGPEGSVTPWPFIGDQQIAAMPQFVNDYVLERQQLDTFEFVYYRRRSAPAPRLD